MPPARTNSKLKTKNSKLSRLVPLLLDWFGGNARDLPWRRTRDPYAIWVSEIMLQQTQVKTVLPYWQRWMQELPTIAALAKASSEKVHKLWEGLGYYTRVRNLQQAAQDILEKHHGAFPEKFEDVLDLSGIGRYTAGAICSIAFNQPTPILDGNVIRVLTRIFGIAANPREKKTNAELWQLAEALVRNAKFKTKNSKLPCSHLNQSLMELGALICTPRQPQCRVCPMKRMCVAFREGRVQELPNLGERTAATTRRFAAFVVERDGRFLVRQRPAGVVNAHLWEFPNAELDSAHFDPRVTARDLLGFLPQSIAPVCTIKHSITRYRITLDTFRIGAPVSDPARWSGFHPDLPGRRPALQGRWLGPADLKKLPFPSAHKKIIAALADPD
jgi:A/G-specific adenine glycosylase